jgi:predicted RNA-binding protein with PIN domain
MRWLIDGYNVIRRDPGLRAAEAESLEAGRAALLRLVAAAARRTTDRFTVVFDGARVGPRAALPGQIEVVFSPPGRTADDVLADRVRRAGAGGAVVVSSDRAVQGAARRARCEAVTAEEFVRQLGRGGCADDRDADEDAERGARVKRGNPRRLSKRDRGTRRALGRLEGPRR